MRDVLSATVDGDCPEVLTWGPTSYYHTSLHEEPTRPKQGLHKDCCPLKGSPYRLLCFFWILKPIHLRTP